MKPEDETHDHLDQETTTSSPSNLKGTTAIITGASSGIGHVIAEQFAADRANVVVCSREQGHVDPVAERIEESGGRAIAVECDVTDRRAVETLVETTVEEFGAIDTLVKQRGREIQGGLR